MILEKNDVDVSKLFNWSKKFVIENDKGDIELEFYMRLLGDADNSRARVFALRQSADMRARLKDKNSDDYVVSLSDIDNLAQERLVQLSIVLSLRDITQRAVKEVKAPEPKQPKSDAKTEVLEKYQLAVDAYPEKQNKALREFIEKETALLEKAFNALDIDALRTKTEQLMINELCEEHLMKSYRFMSTYLGTFKDEELKIRLFEDYESFANLPIYIKQQFLNAYESLEMSGDDLKKLQGATQSRQSGV